MDLWIPCSCVCGCQLTVPGSTHVWLAAGMLDNKEWNSLAPLPATLTVMAVAGDTANPLCNHYPSLCFCLLIIMCTITTSATGGPLCQSLHGERLLQHFGLQAGEISLPLRPWRNVKRGVLTLLHKTRNHLPGVCTWAWTAYFILFCSVWSPTETIHPFCELAAGSCRFEGGALTVTQPASWRQGLCMRTLHHWLLSNMRL